MVDRRQVVLIMTDSQRWDMLNCYRQTGLKTPQLDRLAAGGVRFERAYTCQPVCGPARAALFTGTWPHANGSWANNLPPSADVRTVGQRLQAAGLRTAYIGKWHLDSHDYFGRGQCPDGWDPDYWYDMRNYVEELSPQDRWRSRQESTIQEGVSADFTFAHRCSNRAADFLERHGDEDFMLVVSYDEPHGPYLCPKEYYDLYADYDFPLSPNVHDNLADKPEHIRNWAGKRLEEDSRGFRIRRPEYFGCNTFVDAEIGRVLDAIDRRCPGAMVIYTSDHGHMELSHRLYIKGPAMYDEIARIPFIVRWPGHAPAGGVNPNPVSHIDVVPTILEYFGVADPGTLDGRSMLGSLPDPASRPNDAVFMEWGRLEVDHDGFGGFEPIRCIFDGRYKLVVNLLTSDELYDVQADPYEMTNLIGSADHAAIRDGLHDRLLAWMNDTRDAFRGYHWHTRPWRTDAPGITGTWHYTNGNRQRPTEASEPKMLDYDTGLPPASRVRQVQPRIEG
ncbi:MAG: Choline-sulfatase [Phycisphaerae bacterium]|nr:Choline-sulfatase [Phycisphaerae bacterium]